MAANAVLLPTAAGSDRQREQSDAGHAGNGQSRAG
jgi:hypothetical protein